jgi:hypothetical protein
VVSTMCKGLHSGGKEPGMSGWPVDQCSNQAGAPVLCRQGGLRKPPPIGLQDKKLAQIAH